MQCRFSLHAVVLALCIEIIGHPKEERKKKEKYLASRHAQKFALSEMIASIDIASAFSFHVLHFGSRKLRHIWHTVVFREGGSRGIWGGRVQNIKGRGFDIHGGTETPCWHDVFMNSRTMSAWKCPRKSSLFTRYPIINTNSCGFVLINDFCLFVYPATRTYRQFLRVWIDC